jgi:hypothetical protein
MNYSGGRPEASWRFMGGEQGEILAQRPVAIDSTANLSNLSEKTFKFEASDESSGLRGLRST